MLRILKVLLVNTVYGNRLLDPSIDFKVKLAIVTELRDSIEVVHSAEYMKFLSFILPAFLNILRTIQPNEQPESIEHVQLYLTRNYEMLF